MSANGASTVEPLLDLRGLVAGILWRRRLWSSFALLGVLFGALATLVMPPAPTAVTSVLIARDGQEGYPDTVMATDVAVFDTTATAVSALEKLNLGERPEDFLKTFEAQAVTANILRITAEGPSGDAAVRRVRALAEVFIAGHVGRARHQAEALQNRQLQLERELADISSEISVASGERRDALSRRRTNLSAEIVALKQEVQAARVAIPPLVAGTQIVDPPRALPNSLVVTGVTRIGVGLVLGLAGGLALAAVLCVTRDRPVLRRDIAAHLGVSVIVQLPASTHGRIRDRGRAARERRRAADTLARLIRESPGSFSLLEIGCPRTTAALARAIADELATDRPVTLIDHLDGVHLEKSDGQDGGQVEIVDIPGLTSQLDGAVHRLGVGSVGSGMSWVDLDLLGSQTLLVVHTGHATTLWLHTVARQLAHAGISPMGIVLVAPYPWDGTDGTLWTDLHSAMRAAHDQATGHPLASVPVPHHNGSSITALSPLPKK